MTSLNKTKYLLVILIVLLTSATVSYGQKTKKNKRKIELSGYVIDAKTKAGPDSVFVTLMRSDSTVIDTMTCRRYEKNRWNMRDRTYYELKVAADSAQGKFIVKAKAPGYYPNTVDYEIKKVARNRWFELPVIYMRPIKVGVPDSVMLDEVVVKATKIKMVQRGDTIVYNADAFPLEEGSMLDALVRQLPGAKLSSEGEITVNGEKVEELTLNGKDFFKGNKKVMLENLPSFTVKNIQVYHKSSEKSKWAGREQEEKKFTMDVQLKRQYNKGFLGNVEVAGGTEDRYMARLFALRYTDCSRLSVYANTNNVNENRKPGRDGDWDPANQPEGSRTTRKAGIDLQITEKEQSWEEQGNVEFSWDKSVDENINNSEQFLSTGNNYSRSMSDRISHSKNFRLNNYFYRRKPYWMYHYTNVNYNENNSDNVSRSMLADEEFSRWGNVQQSLDSAFSMQLNPQLQAQLINRRKDNSLSNYTSFNASHNMDVDFKLGSGDRIEIMASGSYLNVKNKNYSLQDVNYFRIQDSDLYQNKYTTSPNHNYSYSFNAGYTYNASEHFTMNLSVAYNQNYQSNTQQYYDLHNIDGWGMGAIHPLGELPSNYDWDVLAIDAKNSYRSTDMTKNYTASLRSYYQNYNDSVNFYIYFYIPFSVANQRYDYHGGIEAQRRRDYTNFSPQGYIYYRQNKKRVGVIAQYGIRKSQPNISNLIDVSNNSDPLNIRLGNPDLKPSWNEDLRINAEKRWEHGGDTVTVWTNIGAYISATQNAVSQGYTMDKTTGGRTYKPVNVDGNWSWNVSSGSGMDFGKEKRFNFNNDLSYNFSQSVDMVAVAGQSGSSLSKVHNNIWNDNLSLTYRSGDSLSLGISGKLEYRHSTSDQTNFNKINATNFSYGFNGMWRVFRTGITLATDIKMFSRRGYASSDLNTDNLVWNASISRSFMKKKLTARLEMFDILHQLTNTNINVNAMGRYETV
ncbi:MAG: outer membrane beta-barrel protein, partial [Prevotella sp.]|nr:outer membrane beta-barrel protein [Prevotella sp.]